jgi:predicted chitinase
MGAAATQKAVKTYADDDGTELSYFGRGYVQLTWWSNYARASAQLGLGLQLLLDPAQVLQPAIAYQLMAHGMRTGEGFANGRKFSNYFNGAKTDYVKARAMVNGSDHAADIAAIARQFEIILLAAKP